jgi:hypothetical protein
MSNHAQRPRTTNSQVAQPVVPGCAPRSAISTAIRRILRRTFSPVARVLALPLSPQSGSVLWLKDSLALESSLFGLPGHPDPFCSTVRRLCWATWKGPARWQTHLAPAPHSRCCRAWCRTGSTPRCRTRTSAHPAHNARAVHCKPAQPGVVRLMHLTLSIFSHDR